MEFYPQVFRRAAKDCDSVICFGKKNLDKVHDEYKKSPIERVKVLFIRDRDFDVFLDATPGGENVFFTCGYSVENYVCSLLSIRRFLSEKLGVDATEVDIDRHLDRFAAIVETLNSWLVPIYARIFDAISDGNSMDLDAIDIEKYARIVVQGGTLPDANNIPELEAMGLSSDHPSVTSVGKAEAYVNGDAKLSIRGKYLIISAVVWIRATADELLHLHKRGSISQFNRSACSQINGPQVFSNLTAKAEPTERLRNWVHTVAA